MLIIPQFLFNFSIQYFLGSHNLGVLYPADIGQELLEAPSSPEFTAEQFFIDIEGMEGPASLVALLSHSETVVVQTAAIALGAMARGSDTVRNQIITAGALEPLVNLLQHSSAEVARNAAISLCNLSINSSTRCDQIVAAGALAPLVSLLQHSSGEVVRWASMMLFNLTMHSDRRCEQAKAAGILVPLIGALRHSSDGVRKQASSTPQPELWKRHAS